MILLLKANISDAGYIAAEKPFVSSDGTYVLFKAIFSTAPVERLYKYEIVRWWHS